MARITVLSPTSFTHPSTQTPKIDGLLLLLLLLMKGRHLAAAVGGFGRELAGWLAGLYFGEELQLSLSCLYVYKPLVIILLQFTWLFIHEG